MNSFKLLLATTTLALALSCTSNDNNKSSENNVKKNNDSPKKEEAIVVNKAPIININDTIIPKQFVVCMSDSANSMERIGPKLATIYSVKLSEFFKKNKLTPSGAPIAWYKTQKAPYYFEAGSPVAKAPTNLPKGFFVKEISADSAVVAHFFGPYNLLSQGYTALQDWMKDNNKKAKAASYEIYIGDPIGKDGKPVDPYKVRTDIVFPRK
jgi:effector-binding domain-containing protein